MKKPAFPSDQQDKFMLRLPDGMRDRIKAAADANNRSMNAEIVATLAEKYPTRDDLIDVIEAQIKYLREMQASGRVKVQDAEGNPVSIEDAIRHMFQRLTTSEDAGALLSASADIAGNKPD